MSDALMANHRLPHTAQAAHVQERLHRFNNENNFGRSGQQPDWPHEGPDTTPRELMCSVLPKAAPSATAPWCGCRVVTIDRTSGASDPWNTCGGCGGQSRRAEILTLPRWMVPRVPPKVAIAASSARSQESKTAGRRMHLPSQRSLSGAPACVCSRPPEKPGQCERCRRRLFPRHPYQRSTNCWRARWWASLDADAADGGPSSVAQHGYMVPICSNHWFQRAIQDERLNRVTAKTKGLARPKQVNPPLMYVQRNASQVDLAEGNKMLVIRRAKELNYLHVSRVVIIVALPPETRRREPAQSSEWGAPWVAVWDTMKLLCDLHPRKHLKATLPRPYLTLVSRWPEQLIQPQVGRFGAGEDGPWPAPAEHGEDDRWKYTLRSERDKVSVH